MVATTVLDDARLFHVNVNCSDLERSRRFYTEGLGLAIGAHTAPETTQPGAAFGLDRARWDASILLGPRGLRRRRHRPPRMARAQTGRRAARDRARNRFPTTRAPRGRSRRHPRARRRTRRCRVERAVRPCDPVRGRGSPRARRTIPTALRSSSSRAGSPRCRSSRSRAPISNGRARSTAHSGYARSARYSSDNPDGAHMRVGRARSRWKRSSSLHPVVATCS